MTPVLDPEGAHLAALQRLGDFQGRHVLELGFTHAGDVVGGFAAWRDAGLPTMAAPRHRRTPGEPAGMRAPDR